MSNKFTIEYITEIPVTYVFGKDENGICYITKREPLKCEECKQVREEIYNNMIKEYKNRGVK